MDRTSGESENSTKVIYYGKDGKECEEKLAYAYTKDYYKYVKQFRGELVKIDEVIHKKDIFQVKFVRVSKDCFDNYMRYLQKGLSRHYNLANRCK